MQSFLQTLGRPLQRLFVISRRVHVFQDPFARLDPAPVALKDEIQTKDLQGGGNFSHSPRQRGGDSGHRPIPKYIRLIESLRVVHVRDRVQSERCVSAWRSDNRDLGDEWLQQAGCMEDQWDAAKIEQSLVAAHGRTGAPCKNEAGDLGIARHDQLAILRLHAQLPQRSGELR
jgi:hypothetical protein